MQFRSFCNLLAGKRLILLIIFILQVVICVFFGHMKQTFTTDETYSYGLANSVDYAFLDENIDVGWVGSDYFKNYVTSSPEQIFNLKPVKKNQIKDVHPPFFYYIFHMATAPFGDNFTKWSGIGLNLFLLIFADLLMFYVAREFLKSPPQAYAALILWTFSAAGISNILFIRMYFLLTIELLAFIAVHICIFKNKLIFSWRNFLLLFLITLVSSLTHYYFYVFACVFSYCVFLYMLCKNRISSALLYAITVMLAYIVSYIHFPAIISHILYSYRGIEVLGYMDRASRFNVYTTYLNYINDFVAGGFLWLILVVLIAVVVFKNLKVKQECVDIKLSFRKDELSCLYLIMIFSTVVFAFVVIKGSLMMSNRYIYPIYPIIVILITHLLFYVLSLLNFSGKKKYLYGLIIVSLMAMISLKNCAIEYQYPEYKDVYSIAERFKGYDNLLYKELDIWHDYYWGLPLKFIYDESHFFNRADIPNIKAILNERKTYDGLVVTLPIELSENYKKEVLDEILKYSDYNKYTWLYSFGGHSLYVLK